jgi:flagellar hook assembly protein FlgD
MICFDHSTQVGGAEVLDLSGRTIRRLSRGHGLIEWNGCDDRGRPVPAGVYLVRVSGEGGSRAERLTVIR